jgi:hypothetical protein
MSGFQFKADSRKILNRFLCRLPGFLMLSLLMLAHSGTAVAQETTMNALTLGPVTIGEDRVPLSLKQVKIESDVSNLIAEATFVEGSVQWIRMDSVLLVPRARFRLTLKVEAKDLLLQYQGKSFVSQDKNGMSYIEMFIPLFFPGSIDIVIKGEHVGSIGFTVDAKTDVKANAKAKNRRQTIDYSCSSVDLQFSGFDNEYLSAGCYVSKHGDFGAEKGTLEVRWAAPNFRLLDDSEPPYVLTLQPNMPARFTVKDRKGNQRVIDVTASVPEHIPRLKTALGLGPYVLSSHDANSIARGLLTPAVMLYGKFDLTDTNSIRFFEAYFQQETLFNNFGFYYAYDVGAAFDKRLLLSLNIGFQGVQFRHKTKGKLDNMIIFPQGAEMVYRHAFGLQNYNLVLGMFLPTSTKEDYRNYWVRFGKRTFGEWNYLSWRRENRFVQAWGLSIGFPFFTLF